MSDITPPDFATAVGQVRLLIPDIEQLDNPADPSAPAEYIFNDSAIQAFLGMYANNIKRAAAQALRVLASSETLINKVIKTYDYATDGAKLGAELRAQSKALFDEADKDIQMDSYDIFNVVNLHVESEYRHGWADEWR